MHFLPLFFYRSIIIFISKHKDGKTMGKLKQVAIEIESMNRFLSAHEYMVQDIIYDMSYEEACEAYGKETVDRVQFNYDIELTKRKAWVDVDELTEQFMYDLYGDKQDWENIFIMVARNGMVDNEYYQNLDKAIRDMSTLKNEKYNLYYTPALIEGEKRRDIKCTSVNCIYCDIDGIEGINLQDLRDEIDVNEFLMDRYDCPAELLPTWTCISGHGMHLYWIIPTLDIRQKLKYKNVNHKRRLVKQTRSEGNILRRKYTESIVTFFKADRACLNESRILRFPGSLNVKHIDDPKQTRLFHTGAKYLLDELDFFLMTPEKIEEYRLECNEERALKAFETRLLNHTTYEEIKARNTDKREAEKLKKEAEKLKAKEKKEADKLKAKEKKAAEKLKAKEKKAAEKEKAREASKNANKTIEKQTSKENAEKPAESPKTATKPSKRYKEYRVDTKEKEKDTHDWALIHDMEEWAYNGVQEGYRNAFCFIYASICKRAWISEERALKCQTYCGKDFEAEAARTVEQVYKTQRTYYWSDAGIADRLGFTQEQMNSFRCAYTHEQKLERRKAADHRYDEKRREEAKKATKLKKAERNALILSMIDRPAEEVAELAGCSIRTVQSIRKQAKTEGKNSREAYVRENIEMNTKDLAKALKCSETTIKNIKKKIKQA